jgi:hypothetical protein
VKKTITRGDKHDTKQKLILNMKFTCSVEIDLPVEKVVRLFDNDENLKEWQDGFISIEHISGIPGESGAKSRIIFQTGRHKMELIETILVKNLPNEKTGLYEHKQMVNAMTSRFIAVGENKTRYVAEIEYSRFNGFVPKMMA